MKKRATKRTRKQADNARGATALQGAIQQLVLPLVVGVEATKNGLLGFVHQMGMAALDELLAGEAAAIAGPKGKHVPGRTHHHWGTTRSPLPFGGRTVVVERPRVRRRGGGEEELPAMEMFRNADPLPARVAEQVVLGVSTRGYGRSLEPVPAEVESQGTSKSSASRALIEKTAEKLAAFLERKLGDLDLVAMFIDGIDVAGKAVVIALGVQADGTKVPLGLWLGSTENTTLATALLQDLVDRGLRGGPALLFVIDGGKGIRRAIRDVFGETAKVQRCQVHKMRNVRDHLPQARRGHVARQMRDAYRSGTAKVAKKRLQQLATWLERNGEDAAAASLREGLDETLTVLKLDLPRTLSRTFSTTNAIENMNGTLRRVCRNVKRWRGESMIRRWIALGVGEAQSKFRRIKGHGQMGTLIAALRPTTRLEGRKVVA